jgi:endogenous inhibitor of DNA gyrase (YacG/DUF329 family)
MMMFPTLARTMLSPTDALHIECGACGRRVQWSRAKAFQVLGPGAMPSDVAGRFRCAECGERTKVRIWI